MSCYLYYNSIVLLHFASHFGSSLGRLAKKWDLKVFAYIGKVVAGSAALENWEPKYLNLIRNLVNVSSTTMIYTALAMTVNLTLSANHPVHPCEPAKSSAHAYTQNCMRIHRESPEDVNAREQHHTHISNYS